MPRVVCVEEFKTGLGFEIGPNYDDVPTRSQLLTDRQSSCTNKSFLFLILDGSGSIFVIAVGFVYWQIGERKTGSNDCRYALMAADFSKKAVFFGEFFVTKGLSPR